MKYEKLVMVKGILFGSFLFLGLFFLLAIAIGFSFNNEVDQVVTNAKITVNGESVHETLPLSLSGLDRRSRVDVEFDTPAGRRRALFFGCVYAPLRIYVNDKLVYEYGRDGTYPKFMKDPPTHYDSVILPNDTRTVHVRMVYFSPNERSTLSIHEPVIGTHSAILNKLLKENWIPFSMSIFFVFIGLLLLLASVPLFTKGDYAKALLYPGKFALFAGLWQFGENTLSAYLFQKPTLLYFMDFLGLFLLIIPIYKMAIYYLGKPGSIFLNTVLTLLEAADVTAITLQMTGKVSLHRSLFAFHVILPLSVVALFGYSLYETVRFKSRSAKRFMVPFLVLATSAVLEVLNYYLDLIPKYSMIFQMGVFTFTLLMIGLSAFYIRELIIDQRRKAELEGELHIRDQVLNFQKSRIEMLISMSDEIRKQRHDLRHHLHTIDDLISKNNCREAQEYLRSVTDSVPTYTNEVWCDNSVVNSTIGYYAQLARQEEIRLDIAVEIPEFNANISDSSLCVIFGNLMENAIDACRLMNPESRYIRLYSTVNGEMLFISMDNSFNGAFHTRGGEFLSSKHEGIGTGLRSIRSLCETHSGSAEFTTSENRFRSEVCVKI